MKKYILSSIILLLAAVNTAWGQVATVNGTGYTTLADALNAAREAAAGGWNTTSVTVEILENITFSSTDTWTPIVYNQLNPITINGNNKTITNLPGMLYAKSGSGVSSLTINNLTFESPTVNGTTGNEAVIMGYADCVKGLYFNNVTINNATVTGSNYVAAFVGYAAGYSNTNDGPLFQTVKFNNCKVTNSTLTSTGGGSVGALMGHAAGSTDSRIEVEETTVSRNIISTTKDVKAGALFGTVGNAQATTNHPEAGLFVSANVSDNTVTAKGTPITTIYGRRGSEGELTLTNGGSYDNAPIAAADMNDGWAGLEKGTELTQNSNGTYSVEEAKAFDAYDENGNLVGSYATLNEAIQAGGNGCTVKMNQDAYGQQQIDSQMTPVTFDLNGHTLYAEQAAGLNFSMGYYWNGDHVFTIKDTPGGGGINITPKYTGNACISDNTGRTIIVEGGTFTSTGKAVYCTASNGSMTINGGTFNGEVYVHDTGYGHGELSITDGTFNGTLSTTGDAVLVVSGGTFSQPVPAGYCAEGYSPKTITEGVAYTVESNYAAQITVSGTTTKYSTLVEALAAATDGQTITMLKDVELDEPVDIDIIDKSITLDLDSKTISISTANEDYTAIIVSSGTVTITGNGTINVDDNVALLVDGGAVTIENGTFVGTVGVDDGSLTINDGSFGTLTTNDGMTTVNGGTFSETVQGYGGNLVINNGTFTANGENVLQAMSGGIITVNGGSFTATKSGNDWPIVAWAEAGSIVIKGGTFTGGEDSVLGVSDTEGSTIEVSGGQFSDPVLEEFCATGYIPTGADPVTGLYTVKSGAYVAQIGDTKYETLADAFAAAQDGGTITLLADCTGNGISVPQGKFTTGLTVDFNGHTYTVDHDPLAGSPGTQSQAFQLLKDNTITFKNGTIYSEKARMLVQNYSNLTLENMELTLNNTEYTSPAYTLSNNNGNVVIDGTTINANNANSFAFDVCRYASYPSVNVEVKGNSVINGNVEVDAGNGDAKDGFSLTLTSGTLNGEIQLTSGAQTAMAATPAKATVSKNNTFTQDAPDGYVWADNGDGTSTLVVAVAKIGDVGYATLAAAVAAAQAGDVITMIADDHVSFANGGEITIDKAITITGAVDADGKPLYTIYGKSDANGYHDIFITGVEGGEVTISNLNIKNFKNSLSTDANSAPLYVSTNFKGTINLDNLYVSDFNRGGIFLYGGNFNVTDCNIDCANSRSGAFTKGIEIKGNATGTINGTYIGNMEATYDDGVAGIEIYGNGSIVIEDCIIKSNAEGHNQTKRTMGIASSRIGVHDPSGGSLQIVGTEISSTSASLSVFDSDEYGSVNNYSMTVDNSTFDNYIATWSATSSITINSGNYAEDVYADAGTITIHGGNFTNFAPYTGTDGSIVIDGGIFDEPVPEEYCAEGMIPAVYNEDEGTYTVKSGAYVAEVFNNEDESIGKYETLAEAFAAAQDGETITLLADCTGNGISVPQGKFTTGLSVDFNNFTYTVDADPLAGSPGTQSQAFQLLKDNTITFQNGTIYSEKARMLVQNYSNLTLENMTLTLNNTEYTSPAYTLSNNNGNVVIDGTTINANNANSFAFDVCRYASYPSVNVTVKGESVINGNVEISASGNDAKDGFSLMLEEGTLNGDIIMDATAAAAMAATPDKATVSKQNTFTQDAPDGYVWKDNGDGTSTLVVAVAKIGDVGYATLADAVTAASDGATIEVIADGPMGGRATIDGKTITIIGAGTIDASGNTNGNDDGITVKNGGVLNLNTTTNQGNITFDGGGSTYHSAGIFQTEGNGTVNMYDGISVKKYNSNTEGYVQIKGDGDVFNMYGGSLGSSDDAATFGITVGTYGETTTGVFNLYGGTITGSENEYWPVSVISGTFNMAGGNVIGANPDYEDAAIIGWYDGKITISGGKVNGLVDKAEDSETPFTGSIKISGGYFPNPVPEAYCAPEYIPDPETVTIDNVTYYTVKNGIYVASVTVGETTTKFDNLADAFAAANAASGSTLTLLNNVEVTNADLNGVTDTPPYLVTGNFTLDLNGKTIEYTGTSTLTTGVIGVKRGGDLTVKDSSNPSTGEINSGSKAYAAIAVTVKGEAATGADAKLTVNSGTIIGDYYAITGNGSRHNTEITINGGVIKGNHTNDNLGIYHPQNGTLTITGGKITGYSSAIEVRSGTLNVTGGTFETTATSYSCNPNGSGTTTVGAAIAIAQHTTNQQITASITGGTFVTPDGSDAIPLSIQNPQNNTFDNVTVSSAILALVEGSEIPEGYCWAANGNGTYSLEKGKVKIAKTVGDNIKDIYYASLETAVADVADGETITLLENVTMADHAVAAKLTTAGQSFQINLGNYDITNIAGDDTYSVKLAKGVMAKTSKATDIFNVKDDVEDATIVSGPTHAQTGHYAYYAATTTTGVSYIDAAGTGTTTNADTHVIVIDERMDVMQTMEYDGWFYVNNNVTLSNLKAIGTGAVNLILGDGKTLAHTNANGLTVNNLTVFGQAEQSGKMTLTSTLGKNDANAIITINGGIVIINSGDEGTAMKAGKIYVNAGQVEAHGAHGMVEVTGSTIELGLRDPEQYPDDYIIADTYEGTVVIADGQTLYDSDDHYREYSGTLTDAQKAAIAGHKLVRATNVFAAQRIVNDEVVANYETLKDAFDAVQDGETIKLLRNVHLNDVGVGSSDGNNFTCPLESGTIYLDYNSKTLTGSNRFIRLHTGIKVITNKVYNGDQSRPTYFINADANSIAIAGLIDETDKYFQVTVLPLTADVPYVDENGDDQTTYAAPLTSDLGTTVFLGSGAANTNTWYYLPEDASFKRLLFTYNNTASLILTDGKTMTVNGGPIEGTNSTKGNLVIYGQTEQTGALNMAWQGNQTVCMLTYTQNGGNVSSTGSFNINTITINEGNLSVTGNGGGYAPLGRLADDSSVTINGGTVDVKRAAKPGSNENAINANNITISGGELKAESTNTAIYAQNNITITGGKTTVKSNEENNNYGFRAGGTISMSLSKNDEYINSINGKYRANTIVIPYGLYAQGEGEKYIGVVSADDINNKKLVLQPYEAVIDFGGTTGEVFYLTLAEADDHDENGTYVIRLLHNIESPYEMRTTPDNTMRIFRDGRRLTIAAPRGYIVKAETNEETVNVDGVPVNNAKVTTYTSIPVNVAIDPATYNGTAQLPNVTVTDIKNNVELVVNTDFKVTTVSETGYINAAEYVDAIRIQGIVTPEDTQESGYIADIYSNFTILPLNLPDFTITAVAPYVAAGYGANNSESGAAVLAAATISIVDGNGKDWTNLGIFTVTIDNDPTATNNYNHTGSYQGVVHITPKVDDSDPNNVIDYSTNFTGVIPAGNLVIGGDKDIATSNITATVIYTGSAQKPTGAGTTPTVIVKDGLTNAVLAQGTDYELEYENTYAYKDAQTYTNAVTIRGINDYHGVKTVDYIITPKNIADCNIIASTTFTNSVINPADAVQVSDPGLPADPPGNQLLAKGTDYTLTVSQGYTYLNPQTYANAITVTGTGNYTGTVTMDFTITNNGAIDITEAGMVESYVKFTGKNQPPSKGRLIVSVKNPNTGVKETLVYNQDYTFTFNGVAADYYDAKTYSHAVTITGIGNYYGSFTADYVISPRELTERYIVCEAVDPLVWTGTELKLNVNNQIFGRTDNNVILKLVNTEAEPANNIPEDAYMLSSASDYTYTTEPVTMKDPGEYVVTFTGRYNFTGKRTVTVKVLKNINMLADDDIEIPIQILGSVTPNIRPSNIQDMVVTDGDNVLEQGTHYTLTFTDGTTTYQGGAGPYITQQGKYTAIITGKDPYYSGEKRKDFVVVNEYYTYNAQETGKEFAVHITSGKNLTATVGAKTGAAIATDGTSLTLPSTIEVTVPNASPETFTLNGIENGAFAGCDKLRYIDATAMSGYVPETLTRDFDGPFGGLPKQALVYLTGTNIKGENYVYKPGSGDAYYCELFKIYDDLNGSQTGFDGNDYKWAFENVHKFTAYTLENTRILTAGKHYTTCLPYSIDIPRNVKAYTLDATSGQIFGFKEIPGSTIEAYTPYVLIPSTSGQLLSATDVEVDKFPADATPDATKLNGVNPANNNFTFFGTMRYMEGADAAGKYIMQYKDNKSTWLSIDEGNAGYDKTNRACILPMRAYIASTGSGARSYTATFTDIDGIIRTETFTLDDEDTVIYDLSGRRVELLEHGHTYIINGKKVIVK